MHSRVSLVRKKLLQTSLVLPVEYLGMLLIIGYEIDLSYIYNYVYIGLLSSFVEVESIKRHFKSRLVGTVLNGYLCLRKLVVQRTKLIDETQDMLLEMLEDMTTGTCP